MTSCLNTDSFPLEYMTIMWPCQYLETIYHNETWERRPASLVFYECLHFVDQVSSHHQDLWDVVSLGHF